MSRCHYIGPKVTMVELTVSKRIASFLLELTQSQMFPWRLLLALYFHQFLVWSMSPNDRPEGNQSSYPCWILFPAVPQDYTSFFRESLLPTYQDSVSLAEHNSNGVVELRHWPMPLPWMLVKQESSLQVWFEKKWFFFLEYVLSWC